jgi:hypothetical protein
MSASSEQMKPPSVCPDCGGAITEILVNVPYVRHHRPIEDGGWEVSEDVSSVTYIVRCSNAEHAHAYSKDDVPEAVTRITNTGDHFYNTARGLTL